MTKPVQAAPGGSGRSTSFVYDEQGLFVAKTGNELGHELFTTYDPATGKLLGRRGPNSMVLRNGEKVWQRETWRYDGLGREVAYSKYFDDDADGYVLRTVSKVAYLDGQLPTPRPHRAPPRRGRQRLGDRGEDRRRARPAP